MCASPGMKTTQLASNMNNEGLIYAVEIRENRFKTLNKIVESSGATCVQTMNKDVLTIFESDCPGVEYILVDPSCSGSGITDRFEVGQQRQDQTADRLGKLAGFQIKTLRHALTKFPNAKRVVYSTCSFYPEENEDVIRQVLETCTRFKLVDARNFIGENWLNFGSPEFGDLGKFCLYANQGIDFCNGFFVAVFERTEPGEYHQFLNMNLMHYWAKDQKKKDKDKDKRKSKGLECSENPEQKEKSKLEINEYGKEIKKEESLDAQEVMTVDHSVLEGTVIKKQKRKKKRTDELLNNDGLIDEVCYKKNKKKLKKDIDDSKTDRINENSDEQEQNKKITVKQEKDEAGNNNGSEVTKKNKKKIKEEQKLNDEATEKKRKKNKLKQEIDTEIGNNLNNIEDSNNIVIIKKRKKKKIAHSAEQIDEDVPEGAAIFAEGSTENLKSKKKKKKPIIT